MIVKLTHGGEPKRATRAAGRARCALLGALLAASLPSMLRAGSPENCKFGQRVTDRQNNYGLIVSGREGLCLVRSLDGAALNWFPLAELSVAVDPPLPTGGLAGASPSPPPAASPAAGGAVAVLRPTASRPLIYRADRSGHVILGAEVNSAPVRFLVDTGATFVALTPNDASAAGVRSIDLTFNQSFRTANGPARGAPVRLREIRVDQLVVNDVPAVVMEGLRQSVLGMSFLSRLKSFEMHDGVLSLSR